jgi:hypothetical protein
MQRLTAAAKWSTMLRRVCWHDLLYKINGSVGVSEHVYSILRRLVLPEHSS